MTHVMVSGGGRQTDFFSRDVTGDENRSRRGLILLVIGITLVLWAWGSWVYRTSEVEPDQGEPAVAENIEGDTPITSKSDEPRWSVTIMGVVLVLTVVIIAGIVTRVRNASRRSHKGFHDATGAAENHTLPTGRR